MTTEIHQASEKARSALMLYAKELNKAGYNDRCIQDSVMCLALDVACKRD
jgi:hypothetical protein